MVRLILTSEYGRILENPFLKGNFFLRTSNPLRADEYFTALRTERELFEFMRFNGIHKKEYGVKGTDDTFKRGKVHIAVPKGKYGGSLCIYGTGDTMFIQLEDVKKEIKLHPELELEICKKCYKIAFPPKKTIKADRDYLLKNLTQRQLRENKANALNKFRRTNP